MTNYFDLSNQARSTMRHQTTYLRISLAIVIILFCGIAFPFIWRWGVQQWSVSNMYTLDEAVESLPKERVAIVFGARVFNSGRLSTMLRDRMDTAILLYQSGQVDKLLVSGDNRFHDYNEPGEMMAYAIANGVAPEDVQPDYGGRRTYDTCYRARDIFMLDRAVLVTQEFHLPRALLICRSLGVQSIGVIADRQTYLARSIRWSERRELLALVLALSDVVRQQPAPVLGEPIPIE
ncbi:MAG: ElyC/SanA/YdcF family protein [Chloroflexota bacterium]